jgi:hypothetical protein
MKHTTRRQLAAALLLPLALVAGACAGDDDASGLGQGAARVSLDDEGGGGGGRVPSTTTTTSASDAAARDLTRRALARVLGDSAVDRVPAGDFTRVLNRAKAGQGYDALVDSTLRDYVGQAFDRIFRYRNDPATSPGPVQRIGFDETVFQSLLAKVRGTGPRATLALPDGRQVPADADGIWTFVAQSAPVWGSHRIATAGAENCVGGVGPRCKGSAPALPRPVNVDQFTRMDGLQMNYIQMAVAVGSIMHDRSCADRTSTYVVYCNGEPFPDLTNPAVQRAENAMNNTPSQIVPGELEWRKAVYNTRDGRVWQFRFGPYPVDGSQDPASATITNGGMRPGSPADFYQDDIRLRPGRPTQGSSSPTSTWDTNYNREEFAATTVLFAPNGTSLDPMDARFCGRQSFSGSGSTPFTRWGVC